MYAVSQRSTPTLTTTQICIDCVPQLRPGTRLNKRLSSVQIPEGFTWEIWGGKCHIYQYIQLDLLTLSYYSIIWFQFIIIIIDSFSPSNLYYILLTTYRLSLLLFVIALSSGTSSIGILNNTSWRSNFTPILMAYN